MVGLHDHVFVATARDSVVCLPQHEGANKIGASFETPTGRRMMKPSAYMELVSSLKPDICGSLADEVPAWVTEKRNRISVDRTLRWLDDCLALETLRWLDDSLALEKSNGASILGAVVGGSSIEERKRCATGVAMRNVSGFWIGGFGLGESLEERPALLNTVTDCLPKEKLRQISGLDLPEEILLGVAAGIDLFESTYIYHLTLGGFALVFPLDIDERNILDSPQCDMGRDNTKINMRATIYRKDTSPIVNNCSCFTCQNHTRAYINHLLNVHEMLAQTLLEIHNTHHYLGFFDSIRKAIKGGSFDSFRQRFMDDRRAHLISALACS